MKKKTLLLTSCLFIVLLTVFFCLFESRNSEGERKSFSELYAEAESISSSRKEADLFFEEIKFNGIPLLFDKEARCFYYSLSENNDNADDPEVSLGSDRIRIAFGCKSINDELIRNNKSIDLILYDQNRYCIYQLKCTTLPLINIEKFYDKPNYEYDDCTITIWDNSSENYSSISTYDGRVRIRGGQVTSEMPKPGLRLKFDSVLKGDNNKDEKYYDILGLESDNEFVLYTSNMEKDHIRNVFTTNLWYDTCAIENDLNMKLGMSYRYCEVFINGKYWGLCALGNPINEKRHYVELDKDSDKYPLENIYKMNFFGEREHLDYELYGNDYLFFIKTNEDVSEAWQPFIDYMKLLLYSDDKAKLYDSIDLDNALDIYLFYNLVQGWDNAWYEDGLKFRNTYLISKVKDDGCIKMYYIPWDMDRCWGHEREDSLEYLMDPSRNYEMVAIPIENLLELKDDKIGSLIYEKYQALRKDKWSDQAIVSMLEEYERQAYFSGAFDRDRNRWPENVHTDNNDLNEFKDYVMNRIHYFDTYIQDRFS